jgi:GT2 family glycosyltransferase
MFTASIVINNRISDDLIVTLNTLNDSCDVIAIICIFNGNIEPNIIPKIGLEKIKIYRVQNKGYGHGHNFAINKISYLKKSHIIINPDVRIDKTELDKLIIWFYQLKNVGIAAPKIINSDGNVVFSAFLKINFFVAILRRLSYYFYLKTDNGKSAQIIINSTSEINVDVVSGCCMILHYSIVNKYLFDERYFLYYEDYDLCNQIRLNKNLNIIYNPNIIITHHEGRESNFKLKFFFIHLSSYFKYYYKWLKL